MHQVASLLGFHESRDIRYLSPALVPNRDALGRPALSCLGGQFWFILK